MKTTLTTLLMSLFINLSFGQGSWEKDLTIPVEDTAITFNQRTEVSDTITELTYSVYTPKLESGKKYPVVIQMNGALFTSEDHPSYTFSPKLPSRVPVFGFSTIVKLVKELPQVDLNRVYIMGYSIGGERTTKFIYAYPDFCAAAAPMAGGGLLREGPSPFNALAVKDVAIWSFYGDQDPICDYQFMRNNFDSSAAVGGNFKLTTLIGAKHGIGNWIEYAGEDSIAVKGTSTTHAVTHECSTEGVCDMEEMVFIEWLFKQERKPTIDKK
jgi:predicted peptidase